MVKAKVTTIRPVDTPRPDFSLKCMPMETAAEVVQYISEHEDFEATTSAVGDTLNKKEIVVLLRELSVELRKQAQALHKSDYDSKKDKLLNAKVRKTLTCLSPMEEKTLLSAFGVIEKR